MEFELSVEEVKENKVESEVDVEKDYVMVNINEVFVVDSSEILNSILKEEKEENKEKEIMEEVVEVVLVVSQVVEELVLVVEGKEDVVMREEVVEVLEEVVEVFIQKEVFVFFGNQEVVQEVSNIFVFQQELS